MVYDDVIKPAISGNNNAKNGGGVILTPGVNIDQLIDAGKLRPLGVDEVRLTNRFDDVQYYMKKIEDEGNTPTSTIAVYRFDEDGSVTRNGSIGSEPSFSVIALPVPSDNNGIIGKAAKFNSETQARLTAENPLGDSRSFSLSFWGKLLDGNSFGGYSTLSFKKTGLTYGNLRVRFSTLSGPSAAVNDGSITDGSSLSTGIWYNWAITWDNTIGQLKFYKNNTLIGTITCTPLDSNMELMEIIGDFSDAFLIDQLEITNQAEDTDWVSSRYNGGLGFDPTA